MREAGIWILGSLGEHIALVMWPDRTVSNANARLLASAPDLLGALAAETWLVWSAEHRCWWKADRGGYSPTVEGAGRYSLEEALACCQLRSPFKDGFGNKHASEILVPSPEWISARNAALAKAEAR